MKYWLAIMHVTVGNYSFKCNHTVQAARKPSGVRLARHFYDDNGGLKGSSEDGFFFNSGEVFVKIPVVREIPKEVYDIIKEYWL